MEPATRSGRLAGKTAIITGAGGADDGTGIGNAIALTFAAEGANVCVVDRDATRAKHTVEAITKKGGRAIAAVADVTSDADCRSAVEAAAGRLGAVSVLVNNAGIAKRGDLDGFDEADWTKILDVNLKGAVLMTRHALPAMVSAGGGTVLNIGSIAALTSSGGGMFAYGPSKAALLALTRDIAVRYGRSGIRANSIIPGYIHSPMAQANSQDDERIRQVRRNVSPLGIEGTAWDVAKAALFLAGDEATFITGTSLAVDGGVSAVSALKAVDFGQV